MLVQVHVLTKFGIDVAAFTSKCLALSAGDKQSAELGLPTGEMDPNSFHYSVSYRPSSCAAGWIFVVNADAIPLYAFDELSAADAKARTIKLGDLGTRVTINRVRLISGSESELENVALQAAISKHANQLPKEARPAST